jgi:enoyl-CoA hydratase
MEDVSLSPTAKITIERQGQIVLIGINRPYIHNRIDPDAFFGPAKAYYDTTKTAFAASRPTFRKSRS